MKKGKQMGSKNSQGPRKEPREGFLEVVAFPLWKLLWWKFKPRDIDQVFQYLLIKWNSDCFGIALMFRNDINIILSRISGL